MTITDAAADIIRGWLRGTTVPHPVVCLIQASDSPPEIEEALKRGVDRKELQQISLAALAKVPNIFIQPFTRARIFYGCTETLAVSDSRDCYINGG